MTSQVQQILQSFGGLTLAEQREVAVEILRRTQVWTTDAMNDDELTQLADELFLQLDQQEARNDDTAAR